MSDPTRFERSQKAERILCDAILEAVETRMDYNIAPRMVSTEYALEEASEWIEILMKRQLRATRETLWRSRIATERERQRSLRAAAHAAAVVTDAREIEGDTAP